MEKDQFKSRVNKGRGNVFGSSSTKARSLAEHRVLKQRGELAETETKSRFSHSSHAPEAQTETNSRFARQQGGHRDAGDYRDRKPTDQHRRNNYHRDQATADRDYAGAHNNRRSGQGDNNSFDNSRFGSFDKTRKFVKRQKKQVRQEQPTYENTHFVDYSKPMRLNRFLANAGKCSRREADEFIQAGVVTVNGHVVTELGSRVVPATDKVMFHDEPVQIERRVYILLNKPKDYVTTAEDLHAKKTVIDLVRNACAERVYPVGRLDRNTTGVLLLTNDGELTSKLTHPSFNKKKIYQVTLDREVTDEDIEKIKTGITLEDGDIKVDEISFVKEEDRKTVGVEIHSGRNRIVRRIFASLNYKVMRLDRVYFAGLTKKNLPRGKWRFLSEKEVAFLKMNANNPTENS